MYRINYKTTIQRGFSALLAAVLALPLLSGCSGTGSMYTPEAYEDSASYSTTALAADGASGQQAAEEGHRHRRRFPDQNKPGGEEPKKEEPVRRAWLEGTGSDLFTVQTVDSYYHFSLNGVSLKLPCSVSDLAAAGWKLEPPAPVKDGQDFRIEAFSYEFVDAVPEEGNKNDPVSAKNRGRNQQIRLCLGNVTDSPVSPSDCTVFGISVSGDSESDLKTAFDAGTGSSLTDLTSVFSSDSSVFTQTRYADGSCMVRYRFSNGLVEDDRIPVLAEAEEKGMAELMLVQTGPDGDTITGLSLYYFRLPQ